MYEQKGATFGQALARFYWILARVAEFLLIENYNIERFQWELYRKDLPHFIFHPIPPPSSLSSEVDWTKSN